MSSFQRTFLVRALLLTGSKNSVGTCSVGDIVTYVEKGILLVSASDKEDPLRTSRCMLHTCVKKRAQLGKPYQTSQGVPR